MAQPILLPPAFDGMAQDFPRNNMPKGKAWNLVDFIPQILGAPAEERGGWAYASNSLTTADASATRCEAGIYAPFDAGDQLLVIDDVGHLLKANTSTKAVTDLGAVVVPLQNPVMHQQTVVIPSPDGTTAPKKYDGTTIAALGATAPAGKYAAVYGNFTWLANTVSNPKRVYASAVGDPTTWSTSGVSASYFDVSFSVTGLAALPDMLLIFGKNRAARLVGTTPPPGTDMTEKDPAFKLGCTQPFSIAVQGAVCAFANETGVFLTNGTGDPTDLTKACGISQYWRNLYTASSALGWFVSGGWFGGYYVCAVTHTTAGLRTAVDAFLFDVANRRVVRLSNMRMRCFMPSVEQGQELYAGLSNTAYVAKLSTMWQPSSTYKNDGDGNAVGGTIETPFYDTQHFGGQRWKHVYVDYDMRDAATDNPTMTLAYATSPEPGANYTSCTPSTLSATTKRTIARAQINAKSVGMAFRLLRTNAAASCAVYGFGATAYQREGSRRDY